jgi:hypothetical protein
MKINYSSGAVSKLLLFLAVAILVIIIIVFIVLKMTSGKKANPANTNNQTTENQVPEPPKSVFDTTLGEVKFTLQDVRDLGSVLRAKNDYEADVTTTERFIQVTVGAENTGKNNLDQYVWDLGNIVDSDGRNFLPDQRAYSFLPKPDRCGAILKPAFKAIPCIKVYEVSRLSKNLKIEVKVNQAKKLSGFLDLQ